MYIKFISFLKRLFFIRRFLIKNKYNRVVPFGDMISDRWEKAKFLGFGEGSSIYDSSLVIGNVKIGNNTWIGPFTVLDGSGGLTIGDNCSISSGVQIYTHNTVKWAVSGGKSPYQYDQVKIGDNCFIGPNVTIQNGSIIGDHCIIAANSFVNKTINNFEIVGGTPAKVIGKIDFDVNGEPVFSYF